MFFSAIFLRIKTTWLIILFFVAMLSPQMVCGITSKADSLSQALSNASDDSMRIQLNLKLGVALEATNFDSAMHYYQQAMRIAQNNQWLHEQAKVKVNIGFAYHYTLQSKQSIRFLNEGIELYKEASDSNGIMDSYYNLGTFYGQYEDYSNSIQSFKTAAYYAQKIGNTERLGMIYNNLGLMYQYAGLYDKANDYQFKALKIKEQLQDPTLSYTHLNIGLNYFQQQENGKSLEHYQIALNYFEELKDSSRIALTYRNMGDALLAMQQYRNAQKMYENAFLIYEGLQNKGAIAEHYFCLGKIKRAQHEWYAAYELMQKAINVFPQRGSKRQLFYMYAGSTEVLMNSFEVTRDGKDLFAAEQNALAMEMLTKELSSIALDHKANEVLYHLYLKKGPQNKALQYAQKYILSKDSLFSEQKQKSIASMQIAYETDRKELEIDLLNSKNELISTRLEKSDQARNNQRMIIYGLVVGILVIALFVVIIYRLNKRLRVQNLQLVENTRLITQQKEEKELLLNEINHRVKNNLQIVSGLLEIQSYSSESELLKEKLRDAQNRIQSIASIHNILYVKEDFVHITFIDFVNLLCERIWNSMKGEKEVSLTISIPKDIRFDLDVTIPLGLILNELLTNSFKYAFNDLKEGKVKIELVRNKACYRLSISDNGPGLTTTQNPFNLHSMGMMIVSSLVNQIGSKPQYDYKNGAIFTIEFSVDKAVV